MNKTSKPIKHKAGVVIYRPSKTEELEVLLISSRKKPNGWVFPGGTVEPNERLIQTAARECLEETGYEVRVGEQLKIIDIERKNKIHRFTFFVGQVVKKTKKYEIDRQLRWVSRIEAMNLVPQVFKPIALTFSSKPIELLP